MKITEKVSPSHPDKVADRISGALVDYCYSKQENPKCAFEVLIGHNACFITGETSVSIPKDFVKDTAERTSGVKLDTFNYVEVPQDIHLANNQKELRCGDNGVFAGYTMPDIHKEAYSICHKLYNKYPTDGKIVLNGDTKGLTICWSNADDKDIKALVPNATLINPLGSWTGGVNVDTGVTGRKLASDFYGIEFPLGGGNMGGKDCSKADVSVNIYCFLKAQVEGKEQKAICSIGDKYVNINGVLTPFDQIVSVSLKAIKAVGGFEKFMEWGLVSLTSIHNPLQ